MVGEVSWAPARKALGRALAGEIDTTHTHTHTHTHAHAHAHTQTQKDPTAYKTRVTSLINCSSQGPAEALPHTGGMRLKENLTLGLPRPSGEKAPARQTLGGPPARPWPAEKGLEALVSSSLSLPQQLARTLTQVPSPTPLAALC